MNQIIETTKTLSLPGSREEVVPTAYDWRPKGSDFSQISLIDETGFSEIPVSEISTWRVCCRWILRGVVYDAKSHMTIQISSTKSCYFQLKKPERIHF